MIEHLRRLLKEIDQTDEDFPGQNREHRRQVIVNHAVEMAQNLIDEGSNGSVEETEYLTSQVMVKFVERVHRSFARRIMMVDLQAEGQRLEREKNARRADGVSGETQ